MVRPPEIAAASVPREEEVRHVPEGGGGNFGKDTEGGTSSVDCKEDPTKSDYFTFDLIGMSKINWREIYQESESNKYSRGETNKKAQEIL